MPRNLPESVIREMRSWLYDVFPDNTETIETAPAAFIIRAVARHYDGGVSGFLADGDPVSSENLSMGA